ncbi:MAG: tetratricopeptide repeat protein, partial [Nostoc sp.]
MGQYAEAEPLYREALEIIAKTQGVNHPHYPISLDSLPLLYHSMGKYIEAETLYREAIEIKSKVFGTNHHIYAVSLNNLA